MTVHFADRIAQFKPYFFAQLNKKIAALKAQGMDIIRLDIGSPDMPPAEFIVDRLVEMARRPDTHAYTPYGGTQRFHEAIATYYDRRFGVKLEPVKETLALIGSKEGLFHLSQVLLEPGDVSLVPDPGYPTYTAGALIAGAEIVYLPLTAESDFFPDLEAIPEDVARRAKLLWLNYPNNPTGATATLDDFARAVDFARRHDLIVVNDAPYVEVCYDGYRAPSILQVPGAKDVAVEVNSLSKAYNMAGWRLGMLVGNADVVRMVGVYKSQVDTSHFLPALEAGITALTGDQSWIETRNAEYQARRDMVLAALPDLGLQAASPKAALYIWARLPEGVPSMEFCSAMLEETGVSTTPGVVFGAHGEGYLRISLCTPRDRLAEALDRLRAWERVPV